MCNLLSHATPFKRLQLSRTAQKFKKVEDNQCIDHWTKKIPSVSSSHWAVKTHNM